MKTRKRTRDEANEASSKAIAKQQKLMEQRFINDSRLYELIHSKQWESTLELLSFRTRRHEQVLKNLIMKRPDSPLWTIVHDNTFLSDVAKDVCLRLIEIGGRGIVFKRGFERICWRSCELHTAITVLHCACRNNDPEHYEACNEDDHENLLKVIDKLLEVGGQEYLFLEDSHRCTAWNYACSIQGKQDVKIVERLYDLGRDNILYSKSHEEDCWFNALHSCLYLYQDSNQSLYVFNFLTRHGGEKLVFMLDGQGRTPLHHACCIAGTHGLEIISRLLDIGGKKLALMTDHMFKSTLQHALENKIEKVEKIVGLLLEIGGKALVYKTNDDENSVLHDLFYLLENGCFEELWEEKIWLQVLRKLLEAGGKELLTLENKEGYTAIHLLCRHRHYGSSKILQELIKVGGLTVLMQKDSFGNSALHAVCEICNKQSPAMVNDIIVAGGARVVFQRNWDLLTPLHIACQKGSSSPFRVEVINQLLDVGRQKLLFEMSLRGEAPVIESRRWNPCQEVLDRFIEVGGNRAENLMRNHQVLPNDNHQVNHFIHLLHQALDRRDLMRRMQHGGESEEEVHEDEDYYFGSEEEVYEDEDEGYSFGSEEDEPERLFYHSESEEEDDPDHWFFDNNFGDEAVFDY